MNNNALSSAGLTGWQDFLIVSGAIVLAALVALIWIALFRKDPAQQHKRKHHRHGKKRRRREHRKLNPTLAETGGLPPIRTEQNPPGQSPQ
jgi:hypothetical protein